jgi:hypothetical protein
MSIRAVGRGLAMDLRYATARGFEDGKVAAIVGKITHATVIEKRTGGGSRCRGQSEAMTCRRCRRDLRVFFVRPFGMY